MSLLKNKNNVLALSMAVTVLTLSYKSMVDEFKEISEINALYRSVENTASKDSLALLKMSIESKTEVLCAKVRYLSVMSVNSTLKKLGE